MTEFWSGEYRAKKGDVELYMFRKRREPPGAGAPRPVFFLVHGSSFSGRSGFDLQVPGRPDYSMMDYFANLGFDVWTMELPDGPISRMSTLRFARAKRSSIRSPGAVRTTTAG